MSYTLSARSRERLSGVHPDLVRVVERAIKITPIDFTVLEGLRTLDRQKTLVSSGASKTMNSRHIKADNGYGHAVDLAPLVGGQVSWDWPLYHKLAAAVKQAAKEEGVAIEWGGDWKSFKDGPHWQLPWKQYPANGSVKSAKYTGETDASANTKALAAVATGATSAGSIGYDPALKAIDTLVSQQNELSSGDYLRMGIAALILVGTLYFSWKKLK